MTFIAGLRLCGLTAPWVLDGPMNGQSFRVYIEEVLAPTLARGDVVVLDNLPAHKVAGIRHVIAAAKSWLRPRSVERSASRSQLLGSVTTSDLMTAMLCATLAGAFIPLGGFLARIEHIRPLWLERELRHGVIAFGGGALVAAVALVLVPEGQRYLSAWSALAAFGAGGITFFLIDRTIERGSGGVAQLMAMLLDFVPESLALGAMLAAEWQAGLLLAGLIALQNLPEGFNAYLELRARDALSSVQILGGFCAMVLLGPLAAWFGFSYLRDMSGALGAMMLFAAGGILYLIFEDIAPQAHLARRWAPALGAVAGFMLGLLGQMLLR